MFGIFDIYLLEALVNGVLLGGVFALLALGLNLVFGVIDVVWICYAELIMLGMYGMYFLYVQYDVPFLLAALICIGGVLNGVLQYTLGWPLSRPRSARPGIRRHCRMSADVGSPRTGNAVTAFMTCFALLSILAMILGRETKGAGLPR